MIVVDAVGDGAAQGRFGTRGIEYVSSHSPLSPGEARQLGCVRATGAWIAFLDDDDIFHPDKCREQIAVAVESGASFVTSDFVTFPYADLPLPSNVDRREWDARVASLMASGNRGPMTRPRPGEQVSRYLFERRSLRSRRRLVTSSWLLRGSLAREIPWNTGLKRFEDWDWLLRLEGAGIRWRHLARPYVGISLDGPESLSAADFSFDAAHIAWPIPLLASTAPRSLGDLLVCDIGVTLAKSGDVAGAWRSFRVATTVGKPGWRSVADLPEQWAQLKRGTVCGGR